MAATGAGAVLTSITPLNFHRKISTARFPFPASKLAVINTSRKKPETMMAVVEEEGRRGANLNDYLEQSKDFIRPDDPGPPRWFSPVECGFARMSNRPLLLYLPGVDGVGLGLILNHQRLGGVFDIWCLHIPVMDRTSLTDLVELVERTMMAENCQVPSRPIYLVGESLGACIALAVAARNPDIDLVLVLANPATSFSRSMLEPLIPVFSAMHDDLYVSLPYTLTLAAGDPLRLVMASFEKGLSLQQTFGDLSQSFTALSSYISVMVDILPRETLVWKLQLLKSSAAYVNSRLHAIKAQTLLLTSGRDQFLPSQEEGVQLCRALQNCDIRHFKDSGHFLFLEGGVDLLTVLKSTCFYRRGRYHDHVSDYLPLTSSEFAKEYAPYRWIQTATSPTMFSTLEDGKIVRGLSGVPSEGPVLLVGYHMLLGVELISLIFQFYIEKSIHVRGTAHPLLFYKLRDGLLPELSTYDIIKVMGAVPATANNLFKLFSSKSHILLYPGGMREALHRKGEEYKLCWPEQAEFVRMAARFGATIIPFGAVGEDDVGEVIFDYEDQMKIPCLNSLIREVTDGAVKLRGDAKGEVSNQDIHLPGVIPKVPGRFYFLFGKPIRTEDMKEGLQERDKSHELYLRVKSEVESCIAYLREKRKHDPYRHILPRLLYQSQHGFSCNVPTFEL